MNEKFARAIPLINPQNEAYRVGFNQKGMGLGKDILKTGNKLLKDSKIISRGARAFAPMATTLAMSTGNPLLTQAVKVGVKEGIKLAEKKGYGKKKGKK